MAGAALLESILDEAEQEVLFLGTELIDDAVEALCGGAWGTNGWHLWVATLDHFLDVHLAALGLEALAGFAEPGLDKLLLRLVEEVPGAGLCVERAGAGVADLSEAIECSPLGRSWVVADALADELFGAARWATLGGAAVGRGVGGWRRRHVVAGPALRGCGVWPAGDGALGAALTVGEALAKGPFAALELEGIEAECLPDRFELGAIGLHVGSK